MFSFRVRAVPLILLGTSKASDGLVSLRENHCFPQGTRCTKRSRRVPCGREIWTAACNLVQFFSSLQEATVKDYFKDSVKLSQVQQKQEGATEGNISVSKSCMHLKFDRQKFPSAFLREDVIILTRLKTRHWILLG